MTIQLPQGPKDSSEKISVDVNRYLNATIRLYLEKLRDLLDLSKSINKVANIFQQEMTQLQRISGVKAVMQLDSSLRKFVKNMDDYLNNTLPQGLKSDDENEQKLHINKSGLHLANTILNDLNQAIFGNRNSLEFQVPNELTTLEEVISNKRKEAQQVLKAPSKKTPHSPHSKRGWVLPDVERPSSQQRVRVLRNETDNVVNLSMPKKDKSDTIVIDTSHWIDGRAPSKSVIGKIIVEDVEDDGDI